MLHNGMLRNGASRLALRSLAAPRPAASFTRTTPSLQWATQFGSLSARRPQLAPALAQSAILRRSLASQISEGQKQAESRYSKEEIKPTPETVSSTSSTHPMFAEVGVDTPQKEVDMAAGIKHDVVCLYHSIYLCSIEKEEELYS